MSEADSARMALLETVLTRAAEQLGDLTAPAVQLFYRRFPEALAAFEHHGLGKRERLEAEMVETALYSVMTWVERPIEVSIMLHGSVPHHRNTLHVRPEWYSGLLNSLIDLLAGTIPAGRANEEALIADVRRGLLATIAESLAELVAQAAAQQWAFRPEGRSP